MLVYIPDMKEFLMACEGTGDNLLQEDIDEGFCDYVYIETYTYEGFNGELVEEDGGQLMLEELFVNKYGAEGSDEFKKDLLIKDAMDFIYANPSLDYIEIEQRS